MTKENGGSAGLGGWGWLREYIFHWLYFTQYLKFCLSVFEGTHLSILYRVIQAFLLFVVI